MAQVSKQKNESQERLLPLEGAYNVRDLGGYPAFGGKTVKWGKVFRSGDLNSLTASDQKLLENIGIKTVVDFRSEQERLRAPHRLPDSVKLLKNLTISAGDMVALSEFTVEAGPSLMLKINRLLVSNAQPQYREFFGLLSGQEYAPLLFNCSAGKDRTGFAAAMFLSSLGVEREVIYHDYALSAEYVREKYANLVTEEPQLEAALTVEREYLEAAFHEIDSRFGGVEKYLAGSLGVNLELMRFLYTE